MLRPGFEPGSAAREAQKIDYSALRGDFQVYLGRYDGKTAHCILRYLDRFVFGRVINGPVDVMQIFNGLSAGQIHHLDRALRALLNFCLLKGYSEEWIKGLKRAIPKDPDFIDLRIPSEHEIQDSLGRLRGINQKYRALFNLLLDSGLRLIEAVNLLNGFDEAKLTAVNGFFRYQIGAFRGSKTAYYAYFTGETLRQIEEVEGNISYDAASNYFKKYRFVKPKYLRKFAFDKMVELETPETVADFIQGRVPKRVGARHYMNLVKQADSYYGRYAEYLRALREKVDLQIS